MKAIAALVADLAVELTDRLKMESIPFEVQRTTQEGGLDFSEIMVEDSYFDRACDVAEAWEAERLADAERHSDRHCPKCGSSHLDYGGETFGRSIWQCKDCGNAFSK
jgi:hypothetical protein